MTVPRQCSGDPAEMPWDCLDNPDDPLPLGHCLVCGRYWQFCLCTPEPQETEADES